MFLRRALYVLHGVVVRVKEPTLEDRTLGRLLHELGKKGKYAW